MRNKVVFKINLFRLFSMAPHNSNHEWDVPTKLLISQLLLIMVPCDTPFIHLLHTMVAVLFGGAGPFVQFMRKLLVKMFEFGQVVQENIKVFHI